MNDQITDHPYTGALRRGASCQYTYPAPEGRNPDVCGQQALVHAEVPDPTPEPELELEPVSFKLLEQEQRYVYRLAGFPPLHAHRNPQGSRFLPDGAVVQWYEGDLRVTVEGGRILKDGQPSKRDRLVTAYDRDEIENAQAPEWVADMVLHAAGQGAAVQPPQTPGSQEHEALVTDIASSLDTSAGLAAILNCTHGGDCTVHPGVSGIHNYDPTPADVLDAVMAAVLIRHKFDADDVREIAARYGVELTR